MTVPAAAYTHFAGSPVARGTLGLALVAGQDTYQLPRDFLQVDQASFDVAIGLKCTLDRSISFYDAIYQITGNLSGVGSGSSMGFGVGYVGASMANQIPGGYPGAGAGCMVFRFVLGDYPQLVIMPVPQLTLTLDFWYNASHIAQTVPDQYFEDLMNYAIYAAVSGREAYFASQLSGEDVGAYKHMTDKTAAALNKTAETAHKHWERRFVYRAYMTSG
jgi:hypothetical protein